MLQDPQEDGVQQEENPIINSPFAYLTNINISIIYFLWYFLLTFWNLGNYVAWVRFNDTLLSGTPSSRIYLAFVVISTMLFVLFAGPTFLYTAKYRYGVKSRNKWLSLAIGLSFLLADVPLWVCDTAIWYFYGWQSISQGITFVLRSMSFFSNSLVAWIVYMYKMTKLLQLWRADPAELEALVEEAEKKMARQRKGITK